MNKEQIIEKLAELEHEHWEKWSKSIIGFCMDNSLSAYVWGKQIQKKHESWLLMWVPYDDLSEELKEYDREWARKAYDIVFSGL